MLSHTNMTMNIEQSIAAIQIGRDETVMAVLPMFHIYGMQVVLNCSLRVGATVITLPRFDLKSFLKLHELHGVTRSYVVPPIALTLIHDPSVSNYDLSKLRQIFCGAAPLSEETAAKVSERLGCEIVQGYGMTETSPASFLASPNSSRPSSVGTLVPNTEMMIVDVASGESLDSGQTGEILIRGPQVMIGYLNNERATVDMIDEDGWLHTGDVGLVDEDGFLYVVDRVKELIKVKGFQVAPAELEALLLTHPSILDAAVIGIPDPQSGEVPIAFVVSPDPISADDVKSFVAAEVATYKRLAEVRFVESIPKSPSGKILRRELRAEVSTGTN
jgi:4-coumarate--CoA ligase